MAKLTLEHGTLKVTREASPKIVELPLDALRVTSLFIPRQSDCPVVDATAQDSHQIDLNHILSAEQAALAEWLGGIEGEGATQVRFFLEDYAGRYASISLQDVRESEIDLLQELAEHRRARRDKLADWTRNVPDLIVTGFEGDMATFGLEGIRIGLDRFLAWEDVERLEAREATADDLRTYQFVPRQGRPDGFAVRIPRRKAQLFVAEYGFWRSLAARHARPAA